jgi:hypothetical protein
VHVRHKQGEVVWAGGGVVATATASMPRLKVFVSVERSKNRAAMRNARI